MTGGDTALEKPAHEQREPILQGRGPDVIRHRCPCVNVPWLVRAHAIALSPSAFRGPAAN
jgi:hypothetical protein